MGEVSVAGDVFAAELLLENESFMLCIALSSAFTLTAENASDYGLKPDDMYDDETPEGVQKTWDTRWMGKVRVGDRRIFVRKFEWTQPGSLVYTLTSSGLDSFLCFTDELRCKVPACDLKEECSEAD